MDSRPLLVETVSFTNRCAHRQIQSLAHLHCTAEGKKTRQEREEGTTPACQNHRCRRENENTTLRRSNAPTERTCLLSTQNLCTAIQVHGENLCHHKDVWETVSSRSLPLYRCNQKLPTRFRTVCLRVDFPSRWTRPDIVFRRMRFSAQRQLMSYFTRKSFARCMQR